MNKLVLLFLAVTIFSCATKQISIGMNSDFLKNEVAELETYITNERVINENISSVKVGWHLEHILLTVNEIYKSMESSNPTNFKNRPNLTRIMMFSGNQIPRGKAKAPQIVQPKNDISIENIQKNYEQAKAVLQKFDLLDTHSYFKHPSAGYLKRDDAKRFLKIHTEHHLKIIRDILKVENKNNTNK